MYMKRAWHSCMAWRGDVFNNNNNSIIFISIINTCRVSDQLTSVRGKAASDPSTVTAHPSALSLSPLDLTSRHACSTAPLTKSRTTPHSISKGRLDAGTTVIYQNAVPPIQVHGTRCLIYARDHVETQISLPVCRELCSSFSLTIMWYWKK